jgi:hypothetical protein
VLLALVVVAGCGSAADKQSAPPKPKPKPTPTPTPAQAKPSAVAIPRGGGALAVMAPRAGLTLRNHPNGKVLAHLKPQTDWDSPTVVWAVGRKGAWLGVVATALKNNQVGWLDVRHDRPRMWRSELSLRADLSARTLELVHGARVVKRMTVSIGGPSTPTPTGRFTVTDKLTPDSSVSYYGCCVLALSGHQSHLRPGWAGGDRIAIHGGSNIGTAASAGCLHASDSDLKRLMKLVPVGTPVVIRS